MTNFKTKLATSVATATLLAAVIAPATFASTVKVNNNAKHSVNIVGVLNVKSTTATQTNNTTVKNLTGVLQNTGNNKASDNTGKGDVKVTSHAANSAVTNDTTTGNNSATLSACTCANGDTDVTVSGNAKKSLNVVLVGNFNTTKVNQTNNTTVVNATVVAQNTGNNKANDNTGNGGVTVTSGAANSDVTNTVTTGNNSLIL